MTRVDFFFNVSDKQQKIAEILDTLIKKGRKITLHMPDESNARTINHQLWQQSAIDFIPHCLANDAIASETPVLIHWPNQPVLQYDVIINMDQIQPAFFSRFGRLIELVGHDESDKQYARERFKFYRDRGYEIKSIDASTA